MTKPWVIEVWIFPVRGPGGSLVKPGGWKRVDETEDMAFAKEGVKAIAGQYGVARALLTEPEEGGWCGMSAYRGRGFCCWTGSGGRCDG